VRIISCDGGGIRGVLTARFLFRLEEAVPGFLERAELVAGTSTGSIVAICLAMDIPPSEIVNLFYDLGPKVFKDRDILDGITRGADELFRADFSSEPLKAAMEEVFGAKTRLGDLKKKVLIPSFDLDNQDAESRAKATRVYKARFWKPKYMHNFEGGGSDCNVLAVDAAMRSSSAPTYFPSYQGYVDGGVVDNNPSMSALAKAMKRDNRLSAHTLLSVGTGFNPHYIAGDNLDWGLKQWLTGKRLLNMLFDGMLGVPHYQCAQMLNEHYRRLDATLPEIIDLADISKMDDLVQIADGVNIVETVDWLRNTWMAVGEGEVSS